ncbi:MAG TPA: ABC transporter permease [Puia sp.]|nr:ABC transporter permease [Puia sp.]
MFKNYFKIALRNLKKNKLYSFVNIIGLTIGITSCILIGLYIGHELSYDRFHKNADRIVRITMEYSNGGTIGRYAQTGTKVGPQLKRTFPSVNAFARTFKFPRVITYRDKIFNEKNFLYADSSFFNIFSFQLIKGNPNTALNAPHQLVMTETMAKKYFGNEDPVGKSLLISNSENYLVTGITRDPPGNSQMQFDFIASFSSLEQSKSEDWWTANDITYLLLNSAVQIPLLEKQVTSFMRTTQVRKEARVDGSNYLTYHLEPLVKVHLYSSLDGFEPNGNITYIYILGAIAILILLIACVNYTNLATAQSVARGGEIGIRKVLGAGPGQLFIQHLGKSAFLTFIALLLAVFLSIQLLPLFNRLADKSLTASSFFHPITLFSLLLLGLIVSLLAGTYPAFVLSKAKLAGILKSGFSFTSSGGGLRKSLIVLQFVISVFLIISTIVILQQLSFIQHKKLGFDKDHIVVLPVDYQMHRDYDEIKKTISLNPNVIAVAGSNQNPTFVQWGDGIHIDKGTEQKDLSINCIPADLDFIKTLGMQIIAGTDFSMADMHLMDTSANFKNYRYTFILNESAVKAIGWKPQEAIGRTVEKGFPGIIKAVVKDFHFSSLHQPIGPLLIFLDTQYTSQLFVKISGKDITGTLKYLQTVWKERVPFRPFEYHFLDEDYNALYKVETRTSQLFSFFSTTAILLACLGLFAMTAFTTVQRTKEIGIRKVLGANVLNIASLLSIDFLKLVVIATIIAFPLAWWVMNQWLQDFTYKINIQWPVFVLAGLAAILISMITLSFQAFKAAMANPVNSLRSE